MNDLKCRQAGLDICHSADGQRGSGCSSWLGVAPGFVLVPLFEETGPGSGYLLRWGKAFLILFRRCDVKNSMMLLIPVSHSPFTSVFITAHSADNLRHLSSSPVPVACSQGRLFLPSSHVGQLYHLQHYSCDQDFPPLLGMADFWLG